MGRITVNTDYLILGEQPNEKGQPQQIAVYGRMRNDADRLGVRVLSLAELKQQMGYHTEMAVKKYGPVAPPPRAAGKPAPEKRPAAEEKEKEPDSGE